MIQTSEIIYLKQVKGKTTVKLSKALECQENELATYLIQNETSSEGFQ